MRVLVALHFSLAPGIASPLVFSHLSEQVVKPLIVVLTCFPEMTIDVEYTFICLFAICISPFVKNLFKSFVILFIVFICLLWDCRNPI